jgi:hypothetical protein
MEDRRPRRIRVFNRLGAYGNRIIREIEECGSEEQLKIRSQALRPRRL